MRLHCVSNRLHGAEEGVDGSEMEQIFGVSYPTIKARLNRISGQLQFIDTNPSPSRGEVLERLRNGEITADKAIAELEALK